jgi:uncharacterized protein YndB with AHSA1/START domain
MTVHLSRTGESGPRPEPNHHLDALFGAMTLAASVEIPAPAAAVWDAVTAVERIGEFSPECVAAWWVPGFPASSLGGRFEGKNRVVDGDDVYEWIRPCVIVAFEPFTDFTWTVGDRFDGTPATQWTYRVRPQTSGCVLEQEFQHLADGLSGLRMSAEADPDHAEAMVSARSKDLHAGMLETLSHIRASFHE